MQTLETIEAPSAANRRTTRPIVLLFGGDAGHRNLGDQAMLLEVARRYQHTVHPQFIILCRHPEGMPPISDAEFSTDCVKHFDPPGSRWCRSLFYHIPFLASLWCLGRGMQLLVRALNYRILWRSKLGLVPTRGLVERLLISNLIHCYGGGFFLDSGRNLVSRPFCFVLIAANIMRRKIVITGQGVGPITSAFDRWLVRQAFAGAEVCSVREGGTGNPLLEELCRALPEIRRDGDDAVGLPASLTPQAKKRVLWDLRTTTRPLLAVQYRINEYTGGSEVEKPFGALIDAVIDKLGVHVLFIPFLDADDCDDFEIALHLRERLRASEHVTVLPQGYSICEIRAIIRECDAALGLSYHFLLFALLSGVGSVGLFATEYYRLKLGGLFAHFGDDEYVIDLNDVAVPEVITRLRAVLSESTSDRNRRMEHGREMDQRVSKTFEEIISLITSPLEQHHENLKAPTCELT